MIVSVRLNFQSLFVLILRRKKTISYVRCRMVTLLLSLLFRYVRFTNCKSVEHRNTSFQQYVVYLQALLYLTMGTISFFSYTPYECGIMAQRPHYTRYTPFCSVGDAAYHSDTRTCAKLSMLAVCRSVHNKPISPIISSRLTFWSRNFTFKFQHTCI